jgi:hypothetical protein
MEDKKSSFYEILAANSKPTAEKVEDVKVKPIHTFLSWTLIFLCNSAILWLAWNIAGVQLLNLKDASFLQCILLYSAAKILTRGFFSIQ